MIRINLTQHKSSPAQGCAPRTEIQKKTIKELLTFGDLPTEKEIIERASALVNIAVEMEADEAMVGGANYLILYLDPLLRMAGIQPLYAFSKRRVVETTGPGGITKKVSTFKHRGFVRFKFVRFK
jgi:hypothetical protein